VVGSLVFRIILGKTWTYAKNVDITGAIATVRYYAGWADKIHGQAFDVDSAKFAYTRHEPIGVCVSFQPRLGSFVDTTSYSP
jgi:aldehyde dehydrogenase (NAD+)